mmetsp:Transcript_3915/g.11718  ORF Transcript_3915/g.11718 Transcript_3915/m.11718 type:complete len:82 (-) Transcript_3915:1228-1473(-)
MRTAEACPSGVLEARRVPTGAAGSTCCTQVRHGTPVFRPELLSHFRRGLAPSRVCLSGSGSLLQTAAESELRTVCYNFAQI